MSSARCLLLLVIWGIAPMANAEDHVPKDLLVTSIAVLKDDGLAMGDAALPIVLSITNNSTAEIRGRVYLNTANPIELKFPTGLVGPSLAFAGDMASYRSDVLVIPPNESSPYTICASQFQRLTGEGDVFFSVSATFTTETTDKTEGTDVPLHATGKFSLRKNDPESIGKSISTLQYIASKLDGAPVSTKRNIANEICWTTSPLIYQCLPQLVTDRDMRAIAIASGMRWKDIPGIRNLREVFIRSCLATGEPDVIEAVLKACADYRDVLDKELVQGLLGSPSPLIRYLAANYVEAIMSHLPLQALAAMGKDSPGMAEVFERISAQMKGQVSSGAGHDPGADEEFHKKLEKRLKEKSNPPSAPPQSPQSPLVPPKDGAGF